MKNIFLALITLTVLSGCSVQKTAIKRVKPISPEHFQGYLFIDLATGDTLLSQFEDNYFVPASTTKIFTLYSSLKHMADSLIAFRYTSHGDTLFVKGTGDPSFLNPKFAQSGVFDFMKKYTVISLNTRGYAGQHYGSGWMWDDARDSYQTEISAFPVYGNLLKMARKDSLATLSPASFEKLRQSPGNTPAALRWHTAASRPLTIPPGSKDTVTAPFNTSFETIAYVLQDTLKRWIIDLPKPLYRYNHELKSIPKDTVLKLMMYHSDNMLAEQMLLQSGEKYFRDEDISSGKVIRRLLENELAGLPHKAVWVDGSGLSRYNMFTPADLVFVVNKIREEFGEEAIRMYFPSNGTTGTMQSFLAASSPFLYAKSGSMSGVYNLAGILKTDSGRQLLFAVMNNNFTDSVSEVRNATMSFLNTVKKKL